MDPKPTTISFSDPYTEYLKFVNIKIRHWHRTYPKKELESWCWSTWQGVGEDPDLARLYFYVCIKERGMKYADFLDKKRGAGCGYSGAGYLCVRRATDGRSKAWMRKHPFEVNRALAGYFSGDRIKGDPLRWHGHKDQKNQADYLAEVMMIKAECEDGRPLSLGQK